MIVTTGAGVEMSVGYYDGTHISGEVFDIKSGLRLHKGWEETELFASLLAVFSSAAGVPERTYLLNVQALWNLEERIKLNHITDYISDENYNLVNAVGQFVASHDDEVTITIVDQFIDDLTTSHNARMEARRAKIAGTARRRSQFNSRRDHLLLAMIDSGMEHRCAVIGCTETSNITIDHIVPLSRGGTDELSNLQFLCSRHNSAKGARRLSQ